MESLDSNNSTIPISDIKKATFRLLNSLDGFGSENSIDPLSTKCSIAF